MFDSHARDVYGKSHTQGTCDLLDISSTDNFVHHFESLYEATDLYELKGLQITKYDVAISNNVREVLKRYQVNTSVTKTTVLQYFIQVLQRPLFCSTLFYVTQSFHLLVTGTHLP